MFQEIDIATGGLLFEWRASDHYQPHETFASIGKAGRSKDAAFDYFHINSIDKDAKGNYYISSRYMHTITCIRPSGEIQWILGGRRNDFVDLSNGAATSFSWQHHAVWHENDTLTVFDNGATDKEKTAKHSSGLSIRLDTTNMTATLIAAYVSPKKVLTSSQGSVQILPENGNIFVGWGHVAGYTEFTPDGKVLCDVQFGSSAFFDWGWVKSYRNFKASWVGRPIAPPDIAMGSTRDAVFVSWNGATEVAGWTLQSSASLDGEESPFEVVDHVPKIGFETSFVLSEQTNDYLRVAALDLRGEVLGYSEVLDRRTGRIVSDMSEAKELEEERPHVFVKLLMFLSGFCAAGFGIWRMWIIFSPKLWDMYGEHKGYRWTHLQSAED